MPRHPQVVPADGIQIDWVRVALNIRKAGIPLERASEACGRDRGWLAQIAREETRRIEFHDGLRLLNYHLDTCGADAHRTILKNH